MRMCTNLAMMGHILPLVKSMLPMSSPAVSYTYILKTATWLRGVEKKWKFQNRSSKHGPAQIGTLRLLAARRMQYRKILLHGLAQAGDSPVWIFFITYRWHWWVIFCNFGGNFNDVPPEAIAPLLLGIDIDIDIDIDFSFNESIQF